MAADKKSGVKITYFLAFNKLHLLLWREFMHLIFFSVLVGIFCNLKGLTKMELKDNFILFGKR